ncbi:MAG: hypothetical protein JXR88_17990 [Clostridia bacterium]|nr:hypothetical protein [Clostridia bacterium]
MNRKFKKSLKKRVQGALMSSSFFSILITLCLVLLIVTLIVKPIGQLFTNTVNKSIVENFNKISNVRSQIDDRMNDYVFAKDFMNTDYSILIQQEYGNQDSNDIFTQMSEEDMATFNAQMAEFSTSEIYVSGSEEESINETEKKQIMYAMVQSVQSLDKLLPVSETLHFDWINVEMIISDQNEFSVPLNIKSSKFNEMDHISSEITIYNEDKVIGYIKTNLNQDVLYVVFSSVIGLFGFIAIIVFIIVKIILTPVTFKILKPVQDLNDQLKKISENEVIDSTIKIEQKRPPKEIYELIHHSNIIMRRLNESQELLFAQNQELEAQRDLLEDQNVELENQKEELFAQNEELDSQNDELIQSQLALQKAQDRLVQSEKLASMGQLTAAIAHEINTPLGAVSSNTQMIDMMLLKLEKQIQTEDYSGAYKSIEKLLKSNKITIDAASRVNEIIRNLRNFSRIDQAEFKTADVHEGIHSVLVLTSNLWKNKLTIHENYGKIPEISCFPSMLNQVFMNVIVNGIQATEKGGNISITTEMIEDFIKISIRDDGSGIDPILIEKIFDSGFTTKPKDSGTGLGLSISKDIILKHHGKIYAFNNEDKGATFVIELPIKQ